MENKKILKEARTVFINLKTDPNSVFFSEERIDQRLLKKLEKSKDLKDSQLLKLILFADNKDFLDDHKTPTRADYVEKWEIDRSTLYSFDGPFELLHVDLGNLEFLGKSATIPQYALVIVDLYLLKVYVYPMRSRKQILQSIMKLGVKEKNKRMRLQVDNAFKQVRIKDLNDEDIIEMFTSSVRGGRHSLLNKNVLTVCSCHVTYTFQSESTLHICLNVKELLARNRRDTWSLSEMVECLFTN